MPRNPQNALVEITLQVVSDGFSDVLLVVNLHFNQISSGVVVYGENWDL